MKISKEKLIEFKERIVNRFKHTNIDRQKAITGTIKGIKIFFIVFAVSMLVFTMISVKKLNHDADKGIFGYKMFTVLSDSMKPEFEAGDIIIVKEMNTNKLKAGDVITFYSKEGPLVTHKIEEVTEIDGERAFVTKGINVEQQDKDPVLASRVIGRYSFALPNAGHFFQFIKTTRGYITLVLIPFLLIIGMYGYNFYKLLKQYRGEKKDHTLKKLELEKLQMQEELNRLKEQLNQGNNG